MSTLDALFTPFKLKNLTLANRICMAPMTRSFSPEATPGENVAAYYRARAAGGVGLILTEGVTLRDRSSTFDGAVPRLDGELPVEGWRKVVEEVHAAGGAIFPQLWHVGAVRRPDRSPDPEITSRSPSGLFKPGKRQGDPMSDAEIADTIASYGEAAQNAVDVGFDGIEIHGAHGYLIDQFFWEGTNERHDIYGGDISGRTAFARAVVRTVREVVGPDMPILLRFSQWKQQDYEAKLARSPQELETFLGPLAEAGVDAFHCSTRRFWLPEFEGSDLNLAGWAKKITGLPSITVGSIGLEQDFITTYGADGHAGANIQRIEELARRMEAGEFDLAAVGRALIANPDWPNLVKAGRFGDIRPYDKELLTDLT